MTTFKKVIAVVVFVFLVLAVATVFINKDNDKFDAQVSSELYLEKMSKADKAIESSTIYQAEQAHK